MKNKDLFPIFFSIFMAKSEKKFLPLFKGIRS